MRVVICRVRAPQVPPLWKCMPLVHQTNKQCTMKGRRLQQGHPLSWCLFLSSVVLILHMKVINVQIHTVLFFFIAVRLVWLCGKNRGSYIKWNFKIMYLYVSTYFLMLKCFLWEFRYSVITVSVPFHVSLIKWITLWFTLCKLNHVCKNTRCSKNTRLREGVRYRKR